MKGVGIGGVQIINCNISQNVVSEIKMVKMKLGSHKEVKAQEIHPRAEEACPSSLTIDIDYHYH